MDEQLDDDSSDGAGAEQDGYAFDGFKVLFSNKEALTPVGAAAPAQE